MKTCHAICKFTLPFRKKVVAKLIVRAASNNDMAALSLGNFDVTDKSVNLSRRRGMHLQLHISSVQSLASFDIHVNLDVTGVGTQCHLQSSYTAYMNALRELGDIRQLDALVTRKCAINIR